MVEGGRGGREVLGGRVGKDKKTTNSMRTAYRKVPEIAVRLRNQTFLTMEEERGSPFWGTWMGVIAVIWPRRGRLVAGRKGQKNPAQRSNGSTNRSNYLKEPEMITIC